jgi:hypothetical protein
MTLTLKACIRLAFFCRFLIALNPANGQSHLATGAENRGLANIRLGLSNVWAAYNNPTDMVDDSFLNIGISIANPNGITSLKYSSIAAIVNSQKTSVGAYFGYYGYRVSNHKTFVLSSALILSDKNTLGVSFGVERRKVSGQFTKTSLSTSAAIRQQLTQRTLLHFMIYNLSDYAAEVRHTTNSYCALEHHISNESTWYNQIRLRPEQELSICSGIVYQVNNQLHLILGISTNPRLIAFGFTLQKGRIKMSSAFQHHQILGFTPTLSSEWST